MHESKVVKEFARFAHEYNTYNTIQADVAKILVNKIPKQKYEYIIDIGCGSGEVYKNIIKNKIIFNQFIALDSSVEMISLHPGGKRIEKSISNFNDLETFTNLGFLPKDTLLVSSSALQWSKDLDFVLEQLSKKSIKAYFAIFTANTFKTLHTTAQLKSPIYPVNTLKEVIQKYYNARFEIKNYKLEFNNTRDMFNYIKKSGVSGGEKHLSYRQIKHLMNTYPLKYLEFEVLLVEASSLTHFE